MKITEIRIKDYRQFRNFKLDLTDPTTGEPLEKVCLIGSNGTGKSSLLVILSDFLRQSELGDWDNEGGDWKQEKKTKTIIIKIKLGELAVYFYLGSSRVIFSTDIESDPRWIAFWNSYEPYDDSILSQLALDYMIQDSQIRDKVRHGFAELLTIYAPPDGSSLIRDHSQEMRPLRNLPATNLGEALRHFDQSTVYHVVAYDQLESFWNFLMYCIKQRESDKQAFFARPENQSLTLREAQVKFEADNPEILKELAEHWNLILEQTGLELDIENAKIPVQLNENLAVFVRLKGAKEQIPYNVLSTGIRNFLFRFGHIFSLYFNRPIKNAILLIDEPEASLYPDLLYDLIDRYLAIIRNTQFFVATHDYRRAISTRGTYSA